MIALRRRAKLETLTTTVKSLKIRRLINGCLSATAELNPIKFSNGRTVRKLHLKNRITIAKLHENDLISVSYVGGSALVLEKIIEISK